MATFPRIVRLLSFAAVAAILPVGAAVENMADLDDFGQLAAAALDSVGHFDDRMALDWWRPGRKRGFPFNGKSPGTFEGIDCEQVQEFHIVANANDQAQFNVGACKREETHVRDLAAAAETESANSGMVRQLLEGAKPDARARIDRMLAYRKVALRGGMTGYAFTLVAVGHGIEFVN